MINSVIINGRNVRDIELKYTQGGLSIANFTIACDRGMSKAKKEEATAQGKPVTDFINVVCFSHTAEYVANYLKKGKLVSVEGRLTTGSYENKEGQKVYTTEVLANNIDIMEFENSNNQSSEQVNDDFHPVENSEIPF